MITLNKIDSALVYFSKGWYDTGTTNEEYYEALHRIWDSYYLLTSSENKYIAEHLYTMLTETLHLFDKAYYRNEFLSGIAPGGKYGCWTDEPDIPEYVDRKQMVSALWNLHWKQIIDSCLSILSTLQIYDTGDYREKITLIQLEDIDYTILHKKEKK
jgi:hypothetical protein